MNIMNLYVYENRSMSNDLSKPLLLKNLNVDNVQIHIPKEIDGTDMGTWAWWLVYQNAKREKYSIPMTLEGVTNDEGEEEYISTVGLNHGFTGKQGPVMYAIEAVQADESGAVIHEWHTRTYKLEIVHTLQGNQTEYSETESDIISALISRVNELITSGAEIAEIAETIERAAETAQEVIDSIPSDYNSLSNQVGTNTTAIARKADQATTYTKTEVDALIDEVEVETDTTLAKSAEQLISDRRTVDKLPYKYRASQSGKSDRAYDTIVGGTVAWNQLVNIPESDISKSENGVTFTDNRDGTYTVSTDANGATAQTQLYVSSSEYADTGNHVVFVCGSPSGAGGNTYLLYTNTNILSGGRVYRSSVNVPRLRIIIKAGVVITTPVTFKPQLFDVTAMFGTAIADHIYSLEQATAEAGVALFRQIFPNDYYAYNPGELISVEGLSAKEVTGFNLWDEEWENGIYNPTTGQKEGSSTRVRCKNEIKVLPNTVYYFGSSVNATWNVSFYNDFNTFIGRVLVTNATFVTPPNAKYIAFSGATDFYGSTYNHDICLNISSDKNGQYEPYHKTTYPLDSTLTLRGVPVLKDGKIEFDGDTYASDGTVTRRYAVVDLGTLKWSKSSSGNKFYATIEPKYLMSQNLLWFCERYAVDGIGTAGAYGYYGDDKTIRYYYTKTTTGATPHEVYVHDEAYSTAEALKASLSGVMLVYQLATPTTETATPYTSPQIVDLYGTEEYISETVCPVGHVTEYPDNLRAKLDGLPRDLSMIAPVEVMYTATRNYTTGQLLIVDNTLYKVTSNIANGGNITAGTNVIATTLSTYLDAVSFDPSTDSNGNVILVRSDLEDLSEVSF